MLTGLTQNDVFSGSWALWEWNTLTLSAGFRWLSLPLPFTPSLLHECSMQEPWFREKLFGLLLKPRQQFCSTHGLDTTVTLVLPFLSIQTKLTSVSLPLLTCQKLWWTYDEIGCCAVTRLTLLKPTKVSLQPNYRRSPQRDRSESQTWWSPKFIWTQSGS